MATLMTDRVLLRLSFGIASFVMELVLFILLIVLGNGQRDNNLKYRSLVIFVLIGVTASILDNLFRVSKVVATPVVFQLFLQIAVLVLNIFLTYYVFLYLCTFVKGHDGWKKANLVIVWASVACAVFFFIQAIFSGTMTLSGIGRIIIGYAVELYFLFSSIILVIHDRKKFSHRAFFTALGAYGAIIFTIILQLLDKRGLLLNYSGAVIGSYIFYIGVEIPDYRNLKKSMDVVQTLAEAIDAKDTYTNGHSSRVAAYSKEIARRLGFPEAEQNEIYMMGLLHDVGKIGVPDAVINKPGKLTDDEFRQIRNHPATGGRILANIEDMPKLVTGARWHHERYDGTGYPDGLKGENIPMEARIIAVADAYDAMTSNRSYRRGMDQDKVREQIESGKGSQFDPRLADIMIEMIDEDRGYHLRDENQHHLFPDAE
jgi:HD-GYP domain-containing protein (c-di-GMP phosphodiesterase class II)